MSKRILCFLIILTIIFCIPFAVSATENEVETNTDEVITAPRIYVTTQDGNGVNLQKKDDYVSASIKIVDTDGTVIEDDVQFKVRGNSTAAERITKKAFTFKFDSKTDVLNMGKAKKWALLANTFDPTLMRNYLAFDLAQTMGLEYTSQQRFVELWLDNSFRGCYVLTEPIEEGSTRVDIDIDSNDGKKDFLIEKEFNRYEEDVTYFRTDDIRFAVKEPEEPDEQQLKYIKDTMDDIMNTIKSGDKNAISSKIDIPSFTRYYLLNEFFNTIDFDYSSVFYYYKDGVLYCGPAWDYDLSSGNANPKATETTAKASSTEGLYAAECHLFKYLCTYDWFDNEVRKTSEEYSEYFESITSENGVIDTLLDTYGDVFARNYTDTGFLPKDVWVFEQAIPKTTYEENVEFLRTWLNDRINWVCSYYADKFILGDADGDSVVSIMDATEIQMVLAQLKPEFENIRFVDFDGDSQVSVMDSTAIQLKLALVE